MVEKKVLVATDLRLNRLDAHRYAKANGKTLASHPLVDEGTMNGGIRCSTYAREWLVYPAEGCTFRKDKDIVDSKTGSRIPWSAVNELDICRRYIGLLADPIDLDVFKKTGGIVVLPELVVIIENFIQTDGGGGKVNEKTRLPFEVSKELWDKLSEDQKRFLYRVAGIGVRPLVRNHYRADVWAGSLPSGIREVVFEEKIRLVSGSGLQNGEHETGNTAL